MLKVLYLVLLLQCTQSNAQLQCDKKVAPVTLGGSLHVTCTYLTNKYRFSKKYWCHGESPSLCEVLMDTDGFTEARLKHRAQILDLAHRGLHIIFNDLQLKDSGIYWIGIDKIYADIMVRIQLQVREVPITELKLWPLHPLEGTCAGQQVTIRCTSPIGTNVRYSWLRPDRPGTIPLQSSADLQLHCGMAEENGRVFCRAQNSVSSSDSKVVKLQLLHPTDENCVYIITSDGLSVYDCWQSTLPPLLTTRTPDLAQSTAEFQASPTGSMAVCVNQINSNLLFRSWTGLPLWYELIRWLVFSAMLTAVCSVHLCTRSRWLHRSLKPEKDA